MFNNPQRAHATSSAAAASWTGRRAARIVTSLLAACAVLASAQAAKADDLLSVRSNASVAATLDRVEAAAKAGGFSITVRVDHSAIAERAGLTLRPTALLVFGKPQAGTPLMQCDQRAGIDLPLKALAWQDGAGQVWLGMLDPAVLQARYGLGAACDAPIAAMQGVVRGLLATAQQ